jgi:hypothetical protein
MRGNVVESFQAMWRKPVPGEALPEALTASPVISGFEDVPLNCIDVPGLVCDIPPSRAVMSEIVRRRETAVIAVILTPNR